MSAILSQLQCVKQTFTNSTWQLQTAKLSENCYPWYFSPHNQIDYKQNRMCGILQKMDACGSDVKEQH